MQLDVSTSQLTLGRLPTRGGAAASWDKFDYLSGPRCWVGMRRAHPSVARVPCTLTPSLSRKTTPGQHIPGDCGRGLGGGQNGRARSSRQPPVWRIRGIDFPNLCVAGLSARTNFQICPTKPRPRRASANGPASAGWWKRPSGGRLPPERNKTPLTSRQLVNQIAG